MPEKNPSKEHQGSRESGPKSNTPSAPWWHLIHPALAVATYTLVTAWLTWPLIARLGVGLSTSPDSLLNFWALSWNFYVLPVEPLSLFDANIFFPRSDTLAYSEHLFGVALFAAPAYWLSGSTLFAYNFTVFLTFVFSGLGMYLLAHELTGSRWAALFAGLFYMAVPYRFLHLLHIQLLSAQWFPFIFFFLFRYLRREKIRYAVAASVFALAQILSCNYYALYLALALALFGFALIASRFSAHSLISLRKAGTLLACAVIVSLLSLPFALPYERNRSHGFYRRYEDVIQFSAQPLDYLRPSAFNKVFYVDHLPRQERSEKALFPGITVVLLAGLGLMVGSRRESPDEQASEKRVVWFFFAGLTAIGFLLSLGPELQVGSESYTLPYRFLYRFVPGFRGMRVPARLSILVWVGLGVLSGMGLSRLLMRFPRRQTVLGCVAFGLALFEYQTYPLDRILAPAPPTPEVYTWLGRQPGDFGVIELPMEEDITKEAIRMYYATAHWKQMANGFSGWWPNDYWVLVGRMRHFPTYRVLQFLEREAPVRYVIIHYAQFPEARQRQLRRHMERYRERMPIRASFGTDAVHEILPDTHR